MATKTKMHTAGIYSDMTVDGPEIGTLVVIVDRAKNLPNRKSIGKQDPYCAARLGKEAKKTETDRRGGQTPRWDQELRFTVHDSPDYYQLKVSVFNDDKKTEIIGETWVNLQEVVVPGGGQNDIWHTLSCKGKYAGDIRIEITYYDTRPKQEKAEKIKQSGASIVDDGARDGLKGPRQAKAAVKRRPLPSDPITGAPAPVHDNDQLLPRSYPSPHMAIPDHVQTPPRGYQAPSYIPNQSPLQNVEYSTPPHRFSRSQGYGDSPNLNGYGEDVIAASLTAQPIPTGRYDMYDPMVGNDYSRRDEMNYYEGEDEQMDTNHQFNTRQAPYEPPHSEEYGSSPSPEGPPPPPPAHRSRNNSQHVSPVPPISSHGSYGFSSHSQLMDQFDLLPHEAHRHSMPANPRANSYQAYSPTREDDQFRKAANGYQQSRPHYHSYESGYSAEHRSMQPTVEDAPPTPSLSSHSGHRDRGPNTEHRYEQVPSPAPLNLSGRGSAMSGLNSASTTLSHHFSDDSIGYGSSNSPISFPPQTGTSVSSRASHSSLPQQAQPQRKQSQDPMAISRGGYGLPPVPPTLVAGMDPLIAKEISDRIYQEKRATFPSASNSPRGRHDSPQYQPNRPHPLSYHENSGVPFVPAASTYDESQNRYTTATASIVKPRAISPDPRIPNRKSVSPAPEPSEGRRLSGIPFGPDSYNALNPSLVSSKSTPSLSAKYDPNEVDPDAKIITHDGREIDPSDHIPESNYAPLLETKGPKYASQMPDRNYRPPPNSAQVSPASGRRPLKQAARPQSMTASSPIYMNASPVDPSTPQPVRNRLQKKTNRMSAQPAPHSSPLAPIAPYQDNGFTPKSLPRVNTGDYPNENYAPQHYGSSPGYRGPAGPPPVPAKVPLGLGGPPSPQPTGADAWALLEEMKNIDLGSGRARRRGR
ncbi:Cdc15-interacting C2 domain-containing 1 [Hyphodiscus hymeniophilus]|uniref:Cdc15-interacting C2 domain-containing 1 n=1 Tax=Hyphodiscus hymeniophilus TaxID=353542 RepID=A0A9P6VR83_9HELO|nr:Cdc15-interacting C2 domain-containing 1 [Hyphodiscus hymeniophilus]